jgi:DNA invertase Pin-like site-specific DNA recombinase
VVKASDASRIVGRLVGLVRISDTKGSEIESQKSVIEGFARSLSKSIGHWYADLDRKRWQYGRSEAIRRLLADADDRRFDWVIVDKAQRIGTFNERELFHFLHELERRGVGIWSVAEGDLMDPNVMRSLEMVLGSQSERKEQMNRAQNVARGMRLNALEFRFNGAILPYGYDRICIAADGTERFRVVEDRREENPDHIPGSKEPGRQRWLNWYLVIYAGGHEERRIGPPGKGKHERYEYTPSIRQERRERAVEIFRLYAEGMTRHAIAAHLNESRADPGLKVHWSCDHITQILMNPIYGGRHQWRRQTWAIYSSIRPDGTYEETTDRRPGQRKVRDVEPDGVLRSPKVREDLRLIDDATLAKVARRLAEEGAGKSDGRRARNDSLWLQPFMRCGHCGSGMRSHSKTARDPKHRNPCFRCSNYSRGYLGAGRCVHNRVRLDEVERLTHEFLARYGEEVNVGIEERTAPDTDELDLERAGRLSVFKALKLEMWTYLKDRMPPEEFAKVRDGSIRLVAAYRHYYDREEGQRAAEIAEIEDEIGDLAFKAITFAEDSIARRKLKERIAEMEGRAEALRAALVPLDRRLDAAHRQLHEINAAIKAVSAHAGAKRLRQAGEILRGLIREIRVYSIENTVKGGMRPDRITDRLIFIPVMGDPIEFQAGPPKGTVPPASLARARELFAQGINLNRIATILTEEGIPKGRGADAWNRGTLTRLLAREIAASPGRPDGRSQPHRPRGPAAKDAGR